jgi:uncharacterized protein (DUF433 family)
MEVSSHFELYKGRDPRDLPAYPVEVAARLLLVPQSTLKLWVFGATWEDKKFGVRSFEPIIVPPEQTQHEGRSLSFVNLVEAHVLKALRRTHKVQMIGVRAGVEYLKERFSTDHPLADVDLMAGGKEWFPQFGSLLSLGKGLQIAMEFLRVHLQRIDRTIDGQALRLFPFVAPPVKVGNTVIEQDRRVVAIDPYVSFGRPVINGTGITTDAIADRFWGGDTIESLIEDFQVDKTAIEYALRYENAQAVSQ